MANLDIDVKVISRESIKPSSPTPLHLKTFNLSSFDQAYPSNIYSSILAFYPFLDHDQDRRLLDLKSSLSKTLTRFYPLAGRFIENEPIIDCTDEGAIFIEAKVSVSLSDILKHPDPTLLSRLLPTKILSLQDDVPSGVVLLVQANLFACGGLAIGVSISHKVADGSTLKLFIKGWAAQACGAGDRIEPEISAIASRFPAVSRMRLGSIKEINKLYQTRRYVFDSKSINALKAKTTSASLDRPSRVEVVAGHIWQTTMKLSLRNNTTIKTHVLVQPMNLRNKIDPPLSENSFGNLVEYSFALVPESDDKATELEGLVGEMRRGFQHSIERYVKKNDGQETLLGKYEKRLSFYHSEDVEMITVTSLCRFGFYQNSDFRWGEPVWLIIGGVENKMNVVILTDTKDGDGIEAWVTLEEHVVDLLETDQDFLKFSSMNPSVNLN